MTVAEALREATERLGRCGIDTARADAEFLLTDLLGTTRSGLQLDGARELSEAESDTYERRLRRRARREPVAYILGEWGFRRLNLVVDPRVMIPRPETEVVVERCLALIGNLTTPDVLDEATGSGAIALAIADEHPGARVTAYDFRQGILDVARLNAERTGLADRVRFMESGIGEVFGDDQWDLIVSNPPYVEWSDYETLQPEIRLWEPRRAFIGGLDMFGPIAATARTGLRRGGWLVLEVGDGQALPVRDLLHKSGFPEVRVTPDLNGIWRVLEAQRP